MAFCAAEAQSAFTQRGDVGARDGYIRRDFGQHQIEDRRARVHDAAGQAHDGRAVLKIAEQEHRARQATISAPAALMPCGKTLPPSSVRWSTPCT